MTLQRHLGAILWPVLGTGLLALSGCGRDASRPDERRSTPFVFQALNLRQQDAGGRLLWRVTSPEARYDLSRRLAQARQLRGEIHANGRALYQLQASHGTVINDGAVIQLEGEVRIQRLGADPVTIRATRMRWYPREQRIELDRRAEAFNRQLLLQADRATLLLAEDRLALRGRPQLQRRDAAAATTPRTVLRVHDLNWSPGSGALDAGGPVLATDRTGQGPRRRLQASSLAGNSLTRTLVLQAPVLIEVPDQKAWLKAQATTIDLAANTLQASLPFTAAVGALQIAGNGFSLALDQHTATISQGCQLVQADASLKAGQCQWNWVSQQVQASGGVELRRRTHQQSTLATRLNGTIGKDGVLVFRAPGSRVRSSFRLAPQRTADPVLGSASRR